MCLRLELVSLMSQLRLPLQTDGLLGSEHFGGPHLFLGKDFLRAPNGLLGSRRHGLAKKSTSFYSENMKKTAERPRKDSIS